jgi:hypothetical protein
MSRSYKKSPVISDYSRYRTAFYKRLAAKRVRRADEIDDGASYRKKFESWLIHDYRFRTEDPKDMRK